MKPTDMFVMDFQSREYLRKPKVGVLSISSGWSRYERDLQPAQQASLVNGTVDATRRL